MRLKDRVGKEESGTQRLEVTGQRIWPNFYSQQRAIVTF